MITVINARYYAEAATFVSKDLYASGCIGNVRVEPCDQGCGAIILATNGHVLVVFHDIFGQCEEPVNIRKSTEMLRFKARRKGSHMSERVRRIIVEHETGKVTFIETPPITEAIKSVADVERYAVVTFYDQVHHTADKFVNWRAVVPADPTPGSHIPYFNAMYLAALGGLSEDVVVKGAQIVQKDQNGPAVVRVDGREDFFAVVMPLWGRDIGPAYPGFFDPKVFKVKASNAQGG